VLPGGGEEVDKLMGGRPQIADAPIGGQGSDVQQNAGGAVKCHGLIIGGSGAGRDAQPGKARPTGREKGPLSERERALLLFTAYLLLMFQA
jgi:hypothetical protein